MEPCDGIATRAAQQLLRQHLAEEMMITIPCLLHIKRDEKQLAALQLTQKQLAVAGLGVGIVTKHNRIAQRAAQPIEDGGLPQEALHMGR